MPLSSVLLVASKTREVRGRLTWTTPALLARGGVFLSVIGGDAVVVVPPAGEVLVAGWELDVSAALFVWFTKSTDEKVTFSLY